MPNPFSVGGWDGMAAIFDVVKATKGKFTGDEAMKIFTTGRIPIARAARSRSIPRPHDIVQNVYIRKVEKVDGRYVNTEFDTFPQVKDPWKAENPAK